MKLVKSLLLGATAAVVSVAAANAADLPSRTKGPAVEYVKVCDWISVAGFYVIPGTDTCIKVGGYTRAQYTVNNTGKTFGASGAYGVASGATGFNTNALATAAIGVQGVTAAPVAFSAANFAKSYANQGATARGTAQLDARTRTAYGTLRAVVYIEANHTWGGGSAGLSSSQASGPAINLDKAFIQWAGITAGRAESFFEFYDNVASSSYIGLRASGNSSDLFAYTATFGGGFQATLSVEDPIARRGGISVISVAGITPTGVATGSAAYLPVRAPDVVGALYVEQAWGSAQVAGAYHSGIAGITTAPTLTTSTLSSKTVSGFAILAGVKINLPTLAAGDFFLLQGVYANGAENYLGAGGSTNDAGAGFLRNDSDFSINAATGSVKRNTGYNIVAELRHYWTPTLYSGFFGGYTRLNSNGALKAVDWTLGGFGAQTEYRVGSQLVWVAAPGFTIGLEGMYINTKNTLSGGTAVAFGGNGPRTVVPVGYKKDYSSYIGRLRINRAF